jgi:hypothetical protein
MAAPTKEVPMSSNSPSIELLRVTGPLSQSDLRALAERVPAVVDVTPHVRHDAGRRNYTLLHRDDDLEAWLICWMDDHDTGFHDHDGSSGAVHVLAGTLAEDRLAFGLESRQAAIYGPGATFSFDGAHVHRMSHAGGGPAVSVHVYSPPIRRMGVYEFADDGALRRLSVPGESELGGAELAATG